MKRRLAPVLGSVLALAGVLCPTLGLASEATDGSPSDEFDITLVPDLALTLGMLGVALLLDEHKHSWAGDMSCPHSVVEPEEPETFCDSVHLNGFDRWATELSVPYTSDLSDVLLVTLLLGPFAVAAGDLTVQRTNPGAERFSKDTLVIAQTFAATHLLTTALKVWVKRLRPFNYNPNFVEARREGDSRLSFPSGHTSMAFAGAATIWSLLDQRFSSEPWAIGVSVAAFTLATMVGVLRVLSGRHFPTDVLTGAALGTGMGLLVPYYQRGSGPRTDVSHTALGLGGRF